MARRDELEATRARLRQEVKRLPAGTGRRRSAERALREVERELRTTPAPIFTERRVDIADPDVAARFLAGLPSEAERVEEETGAPVRREEGGPFTVTGAGIREPVTPAERIGEPRPAAVEPAAPPRGAAPAAPGPPTPSAPAEPLFSDLTQFLEKADQTPEMASFKALLEAPAPVFEKVAFTDTERAALGLLAGLRGIEATLPIIEARRADARQTFEAAREARAEKLEGLFRLASASETARARRFTQAAQIRGLELQTAGLGLRERQVRIAERKAGARAPLRLIPPAQVAAIGDAIDVAETFTRVNTELAALGYPGDPVMTLGGSVAFTDKQKKARELLQGAAQEELKRLIGSARTFTELQSVVGPIPSFGDTDVTIRTGLLGTATRVAYTVRSKLLTFKMAGFDTSGLETRLEAGGFSGLGLATPPVEVPEGLMLDPGEVLIPVEEAP